MTKRPMRGLLLNILRRSVYQETFVYFVFFLYFLIVTAEY